MQGGAAIVLPPRLAGSRGLDLDGAQPVRGAGSLSARFAAARTPALRSRGNTAATRENAIPAVHRRGGFHIRPVCGGTGPREGHVPPLHAIRARPAKWDCRSRPGERRAGCPHPAAPRGSAGFRGRDKSRPYGQILCFRQTGRPQCLPRFAGEGHAPPLHGIRARPAKWDCRIRPGERRAGCPHPAAPCGGANVPILNRQGAAGVNARPTEPGKSGGRPGKCNPHGTP